MENSYNVMSFIADTYVRQAQVAYLYHECHLPIEEICRITDYADSTVRRYRNEYLSRSCSIQHLFILPSAPAVHHSKSCYSQGYDVEMQYLENCGEDMQGENMLYLFKFYWKNAIIASKIGTTAQSIDKRLRREIYDYIKKSGWSIDRVEIHKIIPTHHIKPRLVEDYVRVELATEYYNNFVDNDRFMHADIPTDLFVRLAQEGLEKYAHI